MKKKIPPPQAETDLNLFPISGSGERTGHLGSADAFKKTENPQSSEDDNLSDERMDELIDE